MGLLDGIDPNRLQGAQQERNKPTCNPCREGDHGRCPTVLAANNIIESTFPCACHAEDEDEHEAAFDINQEEFSSYWDDGGGWGF